MLRQIKAAWQLEITNNLKSQSLPLFMLPLIASLLIAKLIAELWLASINQKHVRRLSGSIPKAFESFMDEETYQKSTQYTLAKGRWSMLESVIGAGFLAILLFTGLLAEVWESVSGILGASSHSGIEAISLWLTIVVISIPLMPLDWWEQFRLEERFGFNKSTQSLWLMDRLKGLGLSFLLGVPVIWLLLEIINWPNWWIWGFILVFGFQLLIVWVYPYFILPLFNELKPLKAGSLRESLFSLAKETQFSVKSICVMDGSRRSAHANAFFTGFGKLRRIVFFDTLLDQLKEDEVKAVLAHEIGHYKRGHMQQQLLLSGIFLLVTFGLLAILLNNSWFWEGFGFSENALAGAVFLLFWLLTDLFAFWTTPMMSYFSRSNEYEADAFAQNVLGKPDALIQALRTLSKENLSNLNPHPVFSAFYYSHPTLLEREKAMQKDS